MLYGLQIPSPDGPTKSLMTIAITSRNCGDVRSSVPIKVREREQDQRCSRERARGRGQVEPLKARDKYNLVTHKCLSSHGTIVTEPVCVQI